MKAIVCDGPGCGNGRDEAGGAARAAGSDNNDVIVQIHASGFVPTELAWPSTWTDRRDRDRTTVDPRARGWPGVVTALGYGTRGLSVGQRVFGPHGTGIATATLAEYVAIEARKPRAACRATSTSRWARGLPISGLNRVAGTVPARPSSGGGKSVLGARRGRRSRVDGDAART